MVSLGIGMHLSYVGKVEKNLHLLGDHRIILVDYFGHFSPFRYFDCEQYFVVIYQNPFLSFFLELNFLLQRIILKM